MAADPVDPLTNLDELAASLHELFRALTAEGRFTASQACVIIGTMMAHGGSGNGHTD